ncbi:MAG: methyl-accepting chemotaxis protein [Candidatus Omnitrophota bacterium]|jgi:methyl-accepting chemotaxis protein
MDNIQVLNKRKNYFIDKDFQARFILKFCLLVVLAGVITTGILYFVGKKSTTVVIVDSRVLVRSTADFLLPILIQTVLVVMVISGLAAIIVTLLFSHKIAGPLYRFKKVIEGVGSGNLSANFRLRDYDQLKDLSSEVNAMIDKTREQINLIKADLVNLKVKKGNISEQDIEELDKKVNYFKT